MSQLRASSPARLVLGLVAGALLIGPMAAAQAAVTVPAVVTAPALKQYPLQPRSLPGQLNPKNLAKLPAVEAWAEATIADAMDQPAGLMPVQVVSAFHIQRVFTKRLGPEAAAAALRISWRESRLLPNVVNDTNSNKTNDWGLFQLNDGGTLQYAGGTPDESALRPKWNTRAAFRIVRDVGWSPWGGMPH